MTSFNEEILSGATLPAAHHRDMELAAKYACQGPRYTPYPTAPQFSETFPLQQYLD